MLQSKGTVHSPEFMNDPYCEPLPQGITEATIITPYFRGERGSTPVYVTADLIMNNGCNIRDVPFSRPFRRGEDRPEAGDRVLVAFRGGVVSGAVILNYLDTAASSKKCRTLPDIAYHENAAGDKTRIDQNGSRIAMATHSSIDMAVDYGVDKFITFATPALENEYNTGLDSRVYSIVAAVVRFQIDQGLGVAGKTLFQVTHVLRLWSKQDQIYSGNANYRSSPWISPHMYQPGLAVDGLTAIDGDPEKVAACIAAVGKSYVLFHSVPGAGAYHCHCQVPKQDRNIVVPGKSRYAK